METISLKNVCTLLLNSPTWEIQYLKKLFLVFYLATIAVANSSIAQDNIPKYSPAGYFDNVYDRLGNHYVLDDLKINKSNQGNGSQPIIEYQGGSCTAGYFKLHFEAGSGFLGDDPEVVQRRAVLCKVFNDISNFVQSPLTQTGEFVHLQIRNIESVSNGGVLDFALGSPYYSIPYDVNPSDAIVGGVVHDEVWKTINGGHDSFTGIASPLLISSNASSNSGSFYHGFLAINFELYLETLGVVTSLWNLDPTATDIGSNFDLYSVILHEAMHIMGVVSLVNEHADCLFNGFHHYTPYDMHIRSNGAPLLKELNVSLPLYNIALNSSAVGSYVVAPGCTEDPPVNSSGVHLLSTVCEDALHFVGVNVDIPLYTPECYERGSSLSHFEDECYPTVNPLNDNLFFVMSDAGETGNGSIKRQPQPEERLVLCEIGYNVNDVFDVQDQTGVPDYAGGNCSSLRVVGYNDGLASNPMHITYVIPSSQTSIDLFNLLDNDLNAVSILNPQIIIGGGALTGINSSGFTYHKPSSGDFEDLKLIRYVPVSSNGTLGNVTYVFIYTENPFCDPGVCNLLGNGDFENFGLNGNGFMATCGYRIAMAGAAPISTEVNALCWKSAVGWVPVISDSPICGSSSDISNGYNLRFSPWNDSPSNHHYIELSGIPGHYVSNCDASNPSWDYHEAAIFAHLNSALYEGQEYTLEFMARKGVDFGATSACINNPVEADCELNFYATGFSTIVGDNYWNTPVIGGYDSTPQYFVRLIPDDLLDQTSHEWRNVQASFTVPSSNMVLNNIILNLECGSDLLIDSHYVTVAIDDFKLYPTVDYSFDMPATICQNGSLENLAQYSSPPTGVFEGDGVVATQDNFGNTLYSFNPEGLTPGIHFVNYTFTTSNGCSHSLTESIDVLDQSGTDLTVTQVEQDYCLGETVSLQASGALTFQWSVNDQVVSSANTVSINNYQGQQVHLSGVQENGCVVNSSLVVPVHNGPLVNVLYSNPSCALACTGSVGVTSDPTFTYTWLNTNETSAGIQNACVGENTVVVTDQYGCSTTVLATVGVTAIGCCIYNPMTVTAVTASDCPDGETGSIDISISGGTPEYTAIWEGPGTSGLTQEDLTDVPVGDYTVTVYDADDCSTSSTFTIGQFVNSNPPPVYEIYASANSNSVYWEGPDYTLTEDLVIHAPATLVITDEPGSANTLRFAPGFGIIIEPGATLSASRITFTKLENCRMWDGIKALANGPLRSTCELRYARVEYAYQGIKNYIYEVSPTTGALVPAQLGGDIHAIGSIFYNNQGDVELRTYSNGGGTFEMPYSANTSAASMNDMLQDCYFVLDENYMLSTALPRVNLYRVKGVSMTRCTFTNTNGALTNVQGPAAISTTLIAVKANTSSYRIIGRPATDTNGPASTITGFTYGVYSTFAPFGWQSVVRNMNFKCYRGIYAYSPRDILIYDNVFDDQISTFPTDPRLMSEMNAEYNATSASYQYGCYLSQFGHYDVQGNDFIQNSFAIAQGCIMNSCGYVNNTVRRNTFNGQSTACNFYDRNRGPGILIFNGATFSCNDFQNISNIDVSAWNSSNLNSGFVGIARNQGSLDVPAKNEWSDGTLLESSNHLINASGFPFVQYFKSNSDNLSLNEIEGSVNLFISTFDNSCQPAYLNYALHSYINNINSTIDDVNEVYKLTVDGGQTDELLEAVSMVTIFEALDAYYQLMAKSPNLSTQVMIEAIQKEYDLPRPILVAILASNPSAAKDELIWKAINSRSDALSDLERLQVKAGLTWLSEKEYQEATLSGLYAELEIVNGLVIDSLMNDTTIFDKLAGVRSLYGNEQSLADRYRNVLIALQQKNKQQAESLLSEVEFDYKLEDETQKELNDLRSILQVNWQEDEVAEMMDQAVLEKIANSDGPLSSSIAKECLIRLGLWSSDELVEEYQSKGEERSALHKTQSQPSVEFELFPNPASTYFSLRSFGRRIENVKVVDYLGRTLIDLNWKGKLTDPVVDINELAPGAYQVMINHGAAALPLIKQ